MYHGIHDSNHINYDPVYSISPDQFHAHLSWIQEHGFKPVTFDDGDDSNYYKAFPVLKEFGYKAEFFVTSGFIGKPGYVSPDQLREMAETMSIQSHGHTHRFLSDLPESECIDELAKSKSILEEATGKSVTGLSLPGGRGNANVSKEAISHGFNYICNSKMASNTVPTQNIHFNRFPIYSSTDIPKLASMLTGKGWYVNKIQIRQKALTIPKKLLGNQLYDKMHNLIRSYF